MPVLWELGFQNSKFTSENIKSRCDLDENYKFNRKNLKIIREDLENLIHIDDNISYAIIEQEENFFHVKHHRKNSLHRAYSLFFELVFKAIKEKKAFNLDYIVTQLKSNETTTFKAIFSHYILAYVTHHLNEANKVHLKKGTPIRDCLPISSDINLSKWELSEKNIKPFIEGLIILQEYSENTITHAYPEIHSVIFEGKTLTPDEGVELLEKCEVQKRLEAASNSRNIFKYFFGKQEEITEENETYTTSKAFCRLISNNIIQIKNDLCYQVKQLFRCLN